MRPKVSGVLQRASKLWTVEELPSTSLEPGLRRSHDPWLLECTLGLHHQSTHQTGQHSLHASASSSEHRLLEHREFLDDREFLESLEGLAICKTNGLWSVFHEYIANMCAKVLNSLGFTENQVLEIIPLIHDTEGPCPPLFTLPEIPSTFTQFIIAQWQKPALRCVSGAEGFADWSSERFQVTAEHFASLLFYFISCLSPAKVFRPADAHGCALPTPE